MPLHNHSFEQFTVDLKIIKYKLKRYSNKECYKQCRYVKFKGTMTKWPVQKVTHRTIQQHDKIMTQQPLRKITIFLCFSEFSFLFSVYL